MSDAPRRRHIRIALTIALIAFGLLFLLHDRLRPRRTIDDRLAEFGDDARARLEPRLRAAGCTWPPPTAALVAHKDARTLTLHATDTGGAWRQVCSWPILGASGGPGPKLRAGDRQVPEGDYRVVALNPNSRFHVSLRLDYPNADDVTIARAEARDDLGGDIMIHGRSASIGCLAMGDPAAEELFTLAAALPAGALRVLILPCDLRAVPPAQAAAGKSTWVQARYEALLSAWVALAPH